MKIGATGFVCGLLLCATAANAQLYKWTAPDGKITYTDMPPPTAAGRVEERNLDSANTRGAPGTASLPFDLAQATKNSPVTLYTTADCTPCTEGRKMLSQRGIPFVEKTVSNREDVEAFRKAAGANAQVPVLMVGRAKHEGFSTATWNTALTSAGYPESNKLPRTYRNPPAQAAAPRTTAVTEQSVTPSAPAAPAAPAEPSSPFDSAPAAGNAPPGFRF